MPAPRKTPNPFNEELLTDTAAEAEEVAAAPEQQAEAAPAEVPAEAQAPEQAEQSQEQKPQVPERIPYERFKEVNDALKAQQKELLEYRERWARLEERDKQIQEARQAAERQRQEAERAAQRPDPAIDPVGAEMWDVKEQNRILAQNMQQLQNQFQQGLGSLQQNAQQSEHDNWVVNQAQMYAQQNPGYFEAAQYAAQKRMETWQAVGATPEQAREIVTREANFITALSRQTGQHFGPAIMNFAKQMGWQGAPVNGNPAPAPQQTANQQRLQQVQKGQAVQGLNRAPAAGNEAGTNYRNYTPMQLANMSDAEFARIKANPQAWQDLQVAMAAAEGVSVDDLGRL